MLAFLGFIAFILIGLGIHQMISACNLMFCSWEEGSVVLPLLLGLGGVVSGLLLLGHILT